MKHKTTVFYLKQFYENNTMLVFYVRNTYYWKYLTPNLTSMDLLTVYSGKQLHQNRI